MRPQPRRQRLLPKEARLGNVLGLPQTRSCFIPCVHHASRILSYSDRSTPRDSYERGMPDSPNLETALRTRLPAMAPARWHSVIDTWFCLFFTTALWRPGRSVSWFVLPVPVSRRQSLYCIKARFKALGSGPSFSKLLPKPFPMRLRQGMYHFLKFFRTGILLGMDRSGQACTDRYRLPTRGR